MSEGMQIMIYSAGMTVIGCLIVWLGVLFKQTLNIKIDQILKTHDMFLEELLELKEKQIEVEDENKKILLRLENHSVRIETLEKK